MARRPLLTEAQLDYLLRAGRIRQKLSHKALAAKWGVSESTLHHYVMGDRKTVEQWEAERAPARRRRADAESAERLRRMARSGNHGQIPIGMRG